MSAWIILHGLGFCLATTCLGFASVIGASERDNDQHKVRQEGEVSEWFLGPDYYTYRGGTHRVKNLTSNVHSYGHLAGRKRKGSPRPLYDQFFEGIKNFLELNFNRNLGRSEKPRNPPQNAYYYDQIDGMERMESPESPQHLSSPTTSHSVLEPFRVVWNIPDNCHRFGDGLGLDKFGIISNKPRSFLGDEISTLYTPKYGLYPHLVKGNPVNGGIPQLADVGAHLRTIVEQVSHLMSPRASGYGVIDQQLWRAIYWVNFGSFKPYQLASKDLVKKTRKTKGLSDVQITTIAVKEFDDSSRNIMVKTLEELQALRPNVHWGYYGYPRFWANSQRTVANNDAMSWLFEASSALFPSIYYNDLAGLLQNGDGGYIRNILAEAIRVRNKHSKPNIPILAYTQIGSGHNWYPEKALNFMIGIPAEMGLEGVVIWGSSSLFKKNSPSVCRSLKTYVNNVLGPYVSQLTHRLSQCSQVRCSGCGKCVREYFAGVPYILGTSAEPTTVISDACQAARKGEFHNYSCRCYEGYTGACCEKSKSQIEPNRGTLQRSAKKRKQGSLQI